MTTYILIDDDFKNGDGFTKFFNNKKEEIQTFYVKPADWKNQLKYLEILLSNKTTKAKDKKKYADLYQEIIELKDKMGLSENEPIDGIILDLELDKILDTNYKGNSVAQEIRNLSTLNLIIDCPLILFSAPANLAKIYTPDKTSRDLFDIKYSKEKFSKRTIARKARKELISLAEGYKMINKKKDVLSIFCLKNKKEIDYRVIDYVDSLKNRKAPTHEYARFILDSIINVTGLLVDEYILASRLGVEIIEGKKNSSWEKLKLELEEVKYKGAFSEGWERWWMSGIKNWWKDNFDKTLGNLDADERVKLINSKFNLKVKAAAKSAKSSSNYFWVICKKSKNPLSIDDAVLASQDYISVPWQEEEYYSIDEALLLDTSKIHPIERKRLKSLKKTFQKTRR